MTNWKNERICQSCGKKYKARGDSKTCSSTCRSRLARAEAWAIKRREMALELVDELIKRTTTFGAPADVDAVATIERQARSGLLEMSIQTRIELVDVDGRLEVGD